MPTGSEVSIKAPLLTNLILQHIEKYGKQTDQLETGFYMTQEGIFYVKKLQHNEILIQITGVSSYCADFLIFYDGENLDNIVSYSLRKMSPLFLDSSCASWRLLLKLILDWAYRCASCPALYNPIKA